MLHIYIYINHGYEVYCTYIFYTRFSIYVCYVISYINIVDKLTQQCFASFTLHNEVHVTCMHIISSQWEQSLINSNDVHITSEVMGYGSYSVVHSAEYCGKRCVVKKMHLNEKKFQKSFKKECKVLLTLKHPCVIQLLGIFGESKSPSLLMETMWTNLTTFLEEKRSFHYKISILHDVACGLWYIHKKGIIHCDLTSNNILLTENCRAKIADFGQAIIYDQEYDKGLPTAPGNEAHMPPEAFKPHPVYSTKLDVFSFGCVIIHTVTQEFPTPNKYFEVSEAEMCRGISEVNRRSKLIIALKCNLDGSTILYDMVLNCLQDDPHNRPVIEEMCKQLKKLNGSLKHATHSKLLVNRDFEEVADKPAAIGAGLQQDKQQLRLNYESQKLNHVSRLFKSINANSFLYACT